ncbi:MAG: class I SAM-dependent methyltransferase [Flavobacteriales bacterium]
MHHLLFILKYFKYLVVANTRNGIHSPFVLKFYDEVVLSDKNYYSFESIKAVRKALLNNETEITITDFGAGSLYNGGKKKKIKTIAENAAKPEKYGKLYFRMIAERQPKNIVELGTSLGLSTSYLASASSSSMVNTLEGCPETAKMAQKVFNSQKLRNIQITVGNFDDTFKKVLKNLSSLDLVIINGIDQYEPTVRYFAQCLPYINENTGIIFDKVHCSEGMEKAWNEIKLHPEVCVSIDLFFVGMVFFKKGHVKEDFVLKY